MWVYATVSGFRPLLLDVVVPRRAITAPVVVVSAWGGLSSGTHKARIRNVVAGWVVEELTARGIAVASVQYRLSGEALFPAQVHDVKAALRWLGEQRPYRARTQPKTGEEPIGLSANSTAAIPRQRLQRQPRPTQG